MKRGELYWGRLFPRSGSEQKGRRPVVVVSSDGFNEVKAWRSMIVVPITTSTRQIRLGPTTVSLPARETGLPKDSYALCHQITTLDRSKLGTRIGELSRETLRQVDAGIADACDLSLGGGGGGRRG